MSHIPQRKEKDCLNCGTIVQGKFCQSCGQENAVPKETFWHMVTHFFYDITHFDSNFFHTLHHLLFKPGFLSKEYQAGKRASYLHPIKMYVFTSAIFFLLFFKFFTPKAEVVDGNKPLNVAERREYIRDLKDSLKKDTANIEIQKKIKLAYDTAYTPTRNDVLALNANDNIIDLGQPNYRTIAEYDSMEKLLAKRDRDGWLERRVTKKIINFNNKYRTQPDIALKKLGDVLLHNLPYMLFVSLPLFALILRLVYIRRKQFYFADHGVFTIHLYVFSFILLLLLFCIGALATAVNSNLLVVVNVLLFLLLFVYLFVAMRKFYGQGRGKTFVKFLLVALLSFLMMLFLFLFFTIFSAFTI